MPTRSPAPRRDRALPQSLLDLVRSAILADPVSGASREALGLPAGANLLFVRPIVRQPIFITVIGLQAVIASRAQAETQISSALEALLKRFSPFVQGLDSDTDRLDELTNSVLSHTAQAALNEYGGNCDDVVFGDTPSNRLGRYTLANNEKLSLGGLDFLDAS